MLKRFSVGVCLSALLVSLGSAVSATEGHGSQPAIDFRSANMIIYKWYMGPMGRMAKGEMPYDQALFQKNAEALATAARLDLLAGFPKGSTDEDSEAKPEIWDNWSEFEEKFKALQMESEKLADVAAKGDRAATLSQFQNTGKTCGGCHKKFREK